MNLFNGDRTVFDAPRDDKELSWREVDRSCISVAVAKVNAERTVKDEKKIVCLGVGVPVKLPLYLDDHNVIAVVRGDDSGRPVLGKLRQSFFEIDGRHSSPRVGE